MSILVGTATFTAGTGTKTLAIGFTPTWVRVTVGGSLGGTAYYRKSVGFGTSVNQYAISDTASSVSDPQSGKIIQLKDNTGTIIFEGSLTSFPTNQIQFNITTAPSTMPQVIIECGN